MSEETTLQQEVNRLTTALDRADRELIARMDVCRAAQRLYDALHLAGITTVTIKHPVDPHHHRQPDTHSTTIVDHSTLTADAISNLGDALKNLYIPGGPR
jgi:hypothetical protein